MSTILITGGNGLLGKRITINLLSKGHDIRILSRSNRISETPGLTYYQWDVTQQKMDEKAIIGADVVFHLAGAPIAKRWTKTYQQEIMDSRVKSARLILNTCKKLKHNLTLFHSASGINIYKPNTREQLSEDNPMANDYLGKVCQAWEQAAFDMAKVSNRIAISRISMVLANEDGAFPTMLPPFKLGIAPYFGSGKQYYSWIVIDDLESWFVHSLNKQEIQGVFNLSGGPAVPQKEFNKAISKSLGKKVIPFPVPKPLLKLVIGGMSPVLTHSFNVLNNKAKQAGFTPKYDTIEKAINYLFSK